MLWIEQMIGSLDLRVSHMDFRTAVAHDQMMLMRGMFPVQAEGSNGHRPDGSICRTD